MFDEATIRAVEEIAAQMNVETAWLLAVAQVESGGKAFADVNGRQMPLIRWEGHYFDRRLVNGKRDLARHQGLASPTAGAIPNPESQAKRWAIVERAKKIDVQAALESISIGVGQVMAAHWKKLGFKTVQDLIDLACRDVAGQIDVMARYIEKFGLVDELQRGDATAFARGYNGPNFRKGAYHTKIAEAYRRISGQAPESAAMGMLRMGSKGARVRELQALLVRAGHAVKVDGDFGPATKDAVMAEQKKARLKADGVAGPQTMRWLERYKVSPDEKPGEEKISDVPEVKDATKAGGLIALVTVARDQIAEAAGHLTGIEADTAQTLANWLLAGSGIIGAGLTAWAVLGWIRSRRTDEGDVTA